jgi:hypothetical protein
MTRDGRPVAPAAGIDMRWIQGPLMLIAARARRRLQRWLLPVLGIALAAGFAGAVAAEGTIAGDQAARAALRTLSPLDRTFSVTLQDVLTPEARARAVAALDETGFGTPTAVVLLNPVRLSGVVVRPAALDPPSRWVVGKALTRLGPCRPTDCPVVVAGGALGPTTLTAAGVHMTVVGRAGLASAVPLGFAPSQAPDEPPVVLTGDVAGLSALPGLSGVYRTYSWVALMPTASLQSWQLPAEEARLLRIQAALTSGPNQFAVSAPFDGLEAARSQADAAPTRLLLAGGGALAALGLFVVLAAGGLRRDQEAEVERLLRAGARTRHWMLFVFGESAWIAAAGLLLGAGLAVATGALLASSAGVPAGGALFHSLITPAGALALAGALLTTTALLGLPLIARGRLIADVLALAGVSAVALALSSGSTDTGPLPLLLAPICCLAAGVITFRAAAAVLRAGERVARRGPLPLRLALVGLARAPGAPSLATAFIAVTVGLGGFALAYRATLERGTADQAAGAVPLDAIVAPGVSFTTPLQLARLSSWERIAGGIALPVRRTEATYAGAGQAVTVPALGVPARGLTMLHGWRAGDGSAPLAELARRLVPPGPVRTPGPRLPAQTRWLSVRAASPGVDVSITADLRAPGGAITQVLLGVAGARSHSLRARVPPGQWELEALELDEPTGLEITDAHQNGENPTPSTQFAAAVTLGPPRALARSGTSLQTTALTGWRGIGAATAGPHPGVFRFQTSGIPGIVRPPQPSDQRPVPVLVDPQTASAAARGGRIALTVDDLPVSARVVGVLKRFPTLSPDAAGFVVADEATLASALDAQLPGQGQPDELWISSRHLGPLRGALGAGAFAQLGASFRGDIEAQLRSAPVARAVLGTLVAATILSALLAVLGLLASMRDAARDERVERDLEAQGIGPAGLRGELRARLLVAGGLGVAVGLAVAIAMTRLAVATVRAAGTVAVPRPPLVTVEPWGALALWALVALAALALAAWGATRSVGVTPSQRPVRLPTVIAAGRIREEGVAITPQGDTAVGRTREEGVAITPRGDSAVGRTREEGVAITPHENIAVIPKDDAAMTAKEKDRPAMTAKDDAAMIAKEKDRPAMTAKDDVAITAENDSAMTAKEVLP